MSVFLLYLLLSFLCRVWFALCNWSLFSLPFILFVFCLWFCDLSLFLGLFVGPDMNRFILWIKARSLFTCSIIVTKGGRYSLWFTKCGVERVFVCNGALSLLCRKLIYFGVIVLIYWLCIFSFWSVVSLHSYLYCHPVLSKFGQLLSGIKWDQNSCI